MIKDRAGKETRKYDVIMYSSYNEIYKVFKRDGELGVYRNGEFLYLKDELKSFRIINR